MFWVTVVGGLDKHLDFLLTACCLESWLKMSESGIFEFLLNDDFCVFCVIRFVWSNEI